MSEFPLQALVERHGCKYFAENDTGDGETLNLALRSPFIRLYALNRSPAIVEAQKTRFQDNERVQLFTWTHPGSWIELVRLIPHEQPAVFWLHSSENLVRALIFIGRLRPSHADVIIFDLGHQRGVTQLAERYFKHTHRLQCYDTQVDDFDPARLESMVVREVNPNPSWVLFPRTAGR